MWASLLAEGDMVGGSVAGWVAAVSSVGLLAPVLYWLCYHHLPFKDKLLTDELAKKDKYLADLLEASRQEREVDRQARHTTATLFQQAIVDTTTKYEDMVRYERQDCQTRHEQLLATFERRHAETLKEIAVIHAMVRDVHHEVNNLAQVEANRRALNDLPPKVKKPGQRGPQNSEGDR